MKQDVEDGKKPDDGNCRQQIRDYDEYLSHCRNGQSLRIVSQQAIPLQVKLQALPGSENRAAFGQQPATSCRSDLKALAANYTELIAVNDTLAKSNEDKVATIKLISEGYEKLAHEFDARAKQDNIEYNDLVAKYNTLLAEHNEYVAAVDRYRLAVTNYETALNNGYTRTAPVPPTPKFTWSNLIKSSLQGGADAIANGALDAPRQLVVHCTSSKVYNTTYTTCR